MNEPYEMGQPAPDGTEPVEPAAPRQRSRRRRVLLTLLLALVILVGATAVTGGVYYRSVALPQDLRLPQTTTVYYSDGKTVIARLGEVHRTIIDTTRLPEHVTAAVLSAEDRSFRSGGGSGGPGALIRGGWAAARGAGPSTIAEKYAMLVTELGPGRGDRMRVSVLAAKLNAKYSKHDILDFYLNTVYFGRSAYGIEAGAQAYFGKSAKDLRPEEAMALAAVLASPDNGAYDPATNPAAAKERWAYVRDGMVDMGTLDRSAAAGMSYPQTVPYDPKAAVNGLTGPAGQIVRQALSELRRSDAFHGVVANDKAYIENGGFRIVTTVDAAHQRALEAAADETVAGSVMNGQPANLQAAAVAVQPGNGRVLAYFGGHVGTGADFAGWYYNADGDATGYGAHRPGATFQAYAMAAALKAGISLGSHWKAGSPMEFPASGRDRQHSPPGPVVNTSTAPCVPVCTLTQSSVASLNTPFFGLTEQLGAAKVIDLARAAGIDYMWATTQGQPLPKRIDLRDKQGTDVAPQDFQTEVGLGQYPVSVVDQANAMATFAAGGKRADVHFVSKVFDHQQKVVYSERIVLRDIGLSQGAIDDLTWALAQTRSAKLANGRASAGKTGAWPFGAGGATSHAWMIGYTPQLATAVWVGNRGVEQPLRDKAGRAVFGATLPASIYRTFMNAALKDVPIKPFPAPVGVGDPTLGNSS